MKFNRIAESKKKKKNNKENKKEEAEATSMKIMLAVHASPMAMFTSQICWKLALAYSQLCVCVCLRMFLYVFIAY